MRTDSLETRPVEPGVPPGLLLSRDLIFISKITSTAQSLGFAMLTTGDGDQVSSMIESRHVRAVFVDLAAGDLVSPEALAEYRRLAPGATFLAFGSHVDRESLAAASSAGCDHVMPRSRFVNELPDLIRRHIVGIS